MKKSLEKKNCIYYIILLIIFFTSYIPIMLGNKVGIYKFIINIKKGNIIFLIGLTLILFFLEYKNNIKRDIKIIFLIIIFTIFLRNLYVSFFLLIISSFIEREERLKSILLLLSFSYILTLIFYFLGFLDCNIYGIRDYGEYEIFRNSLGFVHPNTTMSLLFPIFSLLYYLYYPKYKYIIISFILIVGKIILDLTYSRTTFLLIILFLILILIKDKYIKKLKYLFLMEGIIIEFLTFYLPIYFKNTILDEVFSGRLRFYYYYLSKCKMTLLGNENVRIFYEKYFLDSSYLQLLFENGIIGFSMLTILISFGMYIFFENKDYRAIRIFSIILIFGFMEQAAFFYYFNVVYFIISDYIFDKENVNRRIS